MRIASYNVENLFSRPRVMNQESWADGKKILTLFAKLNAILAKENYSTADKNAILDGLSDLGLAASDENKFVMLRQNRGKLIKRGASGLEVTANGRGDWIG